MTTNSRSHPGSRLAGAAGFTATELCSVMAIVSILAALAVPALNHHRAIAKRSEMKGALGAVREAERIYAAQWDGQFTADISQLFTQGDLEFKMGPGETLMTTYSVMVLAGPSAPVAFAAGNIDEDASMDVWGMSVDNGELCVIYDDVTEQAYPEYDAYFVSP